VPITVDDPSSEVGRKVVAIIDVDCAVENGFDEVDAKYLGELAELLARSCDW
jgi:L-methionine (R)-S-oxide reductase